MPAEHRRISDLLLAGFERLRFLILLLLVFELLFSVLYLKGDIVSICLWHYFFVAIAFLFAGNIRTKFLETRLRSGYQQWLRATPYDGSKLPPFYSPFWAWRDLRWILLGVGLSIFFAEFSFATVINSQLHYASWFVPLSVGLTSAIIGTYRLFRYFKVERPVLINLWLWPLVLPLYPNPWPMFALATGLFAYNQWTLLKLLRQRFHDDSCSPSDPIPKTFLPGFWLRLAPVRRTANMSLLRALEKSLLIAWWVFCLLVFFSEDGIHVSCSIVLLLLALFLYVWFGRLIQIHPHSMHLLPAIFSLKLFRWRYLKIFLGPLFGTAFFTYFVYLLFTHQKQAIVICSVLVFIISLWAFCWRRIYKYWKFTASHRIAPVYGIDYDISDATSLQEFIEYLKRASANSQRRVYKRRRPAINLGVSAWLPIRTTYFNRSLLQYGIAAGVAFLSGFVIKFLPDPARFLGWSFQWSSFFAIAALYLFHRSRNQNPVFNVDYSKWLAHSCWKPEQPLPLGPLTLVGRDLLLLAWFILLYVLSSRYLMSEYNSFLVKFSPGLGIMLIVLRVGLGLVHFFRCKWYLLIFIILALPGLPILYPSLWLTISIPILILFLNEIFLASSIRYLPLDKHIGTIALSNKTFRQTVRMLLDFRIDPIPLGSTFSNAGPNSWTMRFSRSTGWLLLFLYLWYFFLILLNEPNSPLVGVMIGVGIPVFCAAVLRFIQYEGMQSPIGFFGRLSSGELIIWRYDRLILLPFLIISLTAWLILNQYPHLYAHGRFIYPALALFSTLAVYYVPPNPRTEYFVGIHRIRLN